MKKSYFTFITFILVGHAGMQIPKPIMPISYNLYIKVNYNCGILQGLKVSK